jgi:hypothetical protein
MSRSAYYQEMKTLAGEVRQRYELSTPRVLRTDLRKIYRAERITIDLWPHALRRLRGAYFHDALGSHVMLAKKLPPDPMVFTMAHELKHHLVDRSRPMSCCDTSNQNEMIEIGAEVFAAELIFPEDDFAAVLLAANVARGECTAEDIVRLKHDTRTTLSYAGLTKRAEFLGFAEPGRLPKAGWKALEVKLFGEPVYKRFLRIRGKRA